MLKSFFVNDHNQEQQILALQDRIFADWALNWTLFIHGLCTFVDRGNFWFQFNTNTNF